jgi:pimeloyl-ACP methyl ester carboxylesterase
MMTELRGVLAHTATPAVLVGHSFGAFLVLAYAAQFPRDVAGLVLLDPPTEWHNVRGKRARLLWGGIQLSRLGGVLARVGAVRGSLALLSGGAPGAPRTFVRLFGPAAARTVEHLVGEVRKLPPDIHPLVQELWSQPKCFRAMAEHLAALQDTADAASRVTSLADMPIAIVSGGDQPADIVATHRALAYLSSRGQHIVAAKSAHWIQFDEPELVVRTIRQVIDQVTSERSSCRG